VAHPGRDKPGKPLRAWLDQLEEETRTAGLPLFDWAETKDRPVTVTAASSRKDR
jgi:hypothetical protein